MLHLHLAENRASPAHPFALLATHLPTPASRHVPLGRALASATSSRAAILDLLRPLEAAVRACEPLASAYWSGAILGPLAWTAAEAAAFLRARQSIESAGAAVHLPAAWPAAGRRVIARATVGEREVAPVSLGASALLDFRVSVAMGGEVLSADEVAAIREAGSGLVQIRGQWAEVDAESLGDRLDAWEELAARGGVTAREALQLAEDEGVEAGAHFRQVLQQIRRPESISNGADDLPSEHFRATLRPYQREGVRWLRFMLDLGLGICLADDMGLGKQQSVDTKVLTPAGWREIGSLKVGDSVIGSDGKPTLVEGVFPQGVKPSYRVMFSDKSSVEAGPEHLWTIYHLRGGDTWEALTLTTDQLRLRPSLRRYWPNHNPTNLDLAKTTLRVPILSAPVEFDKVRLPLPAYLVGQLIANGYLAGTGVRLIPNPTDWQEIRSFLVAEGVELGSFNRYKSTLFQGLPNIRDKICDLKMNVLSRDKRIPRIYLQASVHDRIALFQGLMDGDGSCSKTRNKLAYHTISPGLTEDIRELVENLGGIASVRRYDRTHEGKPVEYQVRIRLPVGVLPFRVQRKASRYTPGRLARPCRVVESVEYVRDVESVCIKVNADDQLYVTEHCILTHNTTQTLGLFVGRRHGTGKLSAPADLLVLPASLLGNWQSEIEKFAPSLRTFVAHSSTASPATLSSLTDEQLDAYDVVLATYGTVQRYRALAEHAWGLVVLDEAQNIKNADTKQARVVKQLKAPSRVALTGTPVENRLLDLHSIFEFLNPGLLGSRRAFQDSVRRMRAAAVEGGDELGELRALVSPYILRRLKTDKRVISDLPDKTEVAAYCALTREQAALYQQIVDDLARALEDKGSGIARSGAVLTALLRLKQACNHPSQATGEGDFAGALSGKHARLAEIVDGVVGCGGEKILVFTQFRELVGPLLSWLSAMHGGVKGLALHGGTPVSERQGIVRRFQEDAAVPFMILSLRAGGTGLNLTAASHVVHFDRWWNPAVEDQATDRAYRIGQHRNVMVHKFVVRGTVEERVDQLIASKRGLAGAVLGGEGGVEAAIAAMGDREILDLVALDRGRAVGGE